jgi:hypothetical protein
MKYTCRCVRPILIMWPNDLAFASSASLNCTSAGRREWLISVTAAICIAVGNLSLIACGVRGELVQETSKFFYVSLLLWLMLTWSFGCTGFLDPSSPPMISIARFEITWKYPDQNSSAARTIGRPGRTSFAFMLLCVPLPVWNTTSGK